MNISEVLGQIPYLLANLCENIYIVNKIDNLFCEVSYTGDKIKVKERLTYNDFENVFKSWKNFSLENFEKVESYKELIGEEKNKILFSNRINEYALIFIIDIKKTKTPVGDKLKLLIADDSPIITNFFTKIFKEEFDVIVAKNGNEAIALIEQYQNDGLAGVFLDLAMPEMDGFGVLDYFKEHELFKNIPVSVISGDDSADGIGRATAYGIVDMLQKPFSAEAAKAIVNKTIEFSGLKKVN